MCGRLTPRCWRSSPSKNPRGLYTYLDSRNSEQEWIEVSTIGKTLRARKRDERTPFSGLAAFVVTSSSPPSPATPSRVMQLMPAETGRTCLARNERESKKNIYMKCIWLGKAHPTSLRPTKQEGATRRDTYIGAHVFSNTNFRAPSRGCGRSSLLWVSRGGTSSRNCARFLRVQKTSLATTRSKLPFQIAGTY